MFLHIDSIPDIAKGKYPKLTAWNTLYKVANEVKATILQKTRSGVDIYSKPFHDYSPSYLKYKQKMMAEGGRYVANPEKVTLTDTGDMLSSLAIRKEGNSIVIYFKLPNRARIGYYHHYGKQPMPERKWFGASEETKNRLYRKYQLMLLAEMNK